MEIVIKRNSSKLITLPVRDISDWANCLESAVVIFSMLDISTGCYTVANRPAKFILGIGEGTINACVADGITFEYELSARQSKSDGTFRGEFRVDYLCDGVERSLVYPELGDLDIIIVDSITAMERFSVSTSTPPLNNNGQYCVSHIELNKIEFENLALNGNLKPGVTYDVTMGYGIVLAVIAATNHFIMPFGQLINNEVVSPSTIKTSIYEDLLIFSVFTSEFPSIIRGGSSVESDFPSDARYTYY